MNATDSSTPKSCRDCPALLMASTVPSKFKKATGTPMCGRYGFVLGSPLHTEHDQREKLWKRFAANCAGYGQPMPSVPLEYNHDVALPDPNTIGAEISEEKKQACNTCATCVNYVRDDAVLEGFGWMTGMCAAKGALIMPARASRIAKSCEVRQFGSPRSSTIGIHLLPEYEADFGAYDPVKAFMESAPVSEPSTYPTDKPVSADDEAHGIRAWRKIVEPEGERFVYLPIYDIEKMSPEDRDLVPKHGDPEHPELYVDHFGGVYLAAVAWVELDETPAAWGEPGTGKTELFRHLAYLMQIPFRRISITASTELDDIAGKMHYEPTRGTYFQYGRLPTAWGKAGVICVDEPNVGPPDVWQFLRPLTDNSKQLVLDQNSGEVIKRHDDCYMGMAMNPAWDMRNVGAMQIGDADVNRLFHVTVPLPPVGLEREIIKARVLLDGWEIDKQRLDMVMSIATDLRAIIEEGQLPITWAIRPQIKVARALRWFDPLTAYRRAVADYLEPEVAQVLLDTVRANIPAR